MNHQEETKIERKPTTSLTLKQKIIEYYQIYIFKKFSLPWGLQNITFLEISIIQSKQARDTKR